jgi:hypothetical protein
VAKGVVNDSSATPVAARWLVTSALSVCASAASDGADADTARGPAYLFASRHSLVRLRNIRHVGGQELLHIVRLGRVHRPLAVAVAQEQHVRRYRAQSLDGIQMVVPSREVNRALVVSDEEE